MALCLLLAFWTGGDERQMDRLFRESGLYREKWDEQHFADGSMYGEKTIKRALAGTSEFYEPSGDGRAQVAVSEPSVSPVEIRQRESERLERIAGLERRLSEVLGEKAALEAELVAERERRQSLEGDFSEDGPGERSWVPWL